MTKDFEPKYLGKKIREPIKDLDTFPNPGVSEVTFSTDEVTSHCPITGAPDFLSVTVKFIPDKLCIESKSLKLYFMSFRDESSFAESLSNQIAHDIWEAIHPFRVEVIVNQNPRGGIRLVVGTILNKGGGLIS